MECEADFSFPAVEEGELNQGSRSAMEKSENRRILNVFFLSSQKKHGRNIPISLVNRNLQLPQTLFVVTRHFNDSI